MHKVKQLMNKITDKGASTDPSAGVVRTFDGDRDDQVSAEGFLCPDCMTAFSSAEVLADHYTTQHTVATHTDLSSEPDDAFMLNLAMEQDEVIKLRCALETERNQSMELHRELVNLRHENESRKASLASSKSQLEIEANLRDECDQLRKGNEEWKRKYDRVSIDMDKLKSTTAEEAKILNESLAVVREALSQIQNKGELSEAECKDLRLEAQRLRDQHSELVSRLEGDEGTRAVIDSLTKERNTLTTNLETTQVQNRELSKNLHNIGIELEKLRTELEAMTLRFGEYKDKVEADGIIQRKEVAEKDRLCEAESKALAEANATISSLQKQLTSRSTELIDLKAKMVETEGLANNLEKSAADRIQEINQLNDTVDKLTHDVESANKMCSSADSKILNLQKSTDKKSQEIEALQAENATLQLANGTAQEILQEQSRAFNRYLGNISSVLSINYAEPDSSQLDFDAYHEQSNAIVKEISDKITNMKQNQTSLRIDFERVNVELLNSKKEIQQCTVRNAELEKEMKCQKLADLAELETLRKEIDENRVVFEEKLKIAKKFEDHVAELKEEITTIQKNTKCFQDERDNLQAERLEIDKKYKSSEEARTLLLDRCLASETEAEKFNETIQALQRRLADALAALQELGRENQSLQVEFAKLQGRKWTDDSNASNCSTCSKEFSITVRKHHCRVCGNIFCHECSSKTASIPSSKKPVRVCDACAEELAK